MTVYCLDPHGFKFACKGGVYVSDADGCGIWKKTATGEKSLVLGVEDQKFQIALACRMKMPLILPPVNQHGFSLPVPGPQVSIYPDIRVVCKALDGMTPNNDLLVPGGTCGGSISQFYFPAGLVAGTLVTSLAWFMIC